ncbi:hypothetical protein [Erwinia sp. B116]|uniref:hypothetical protein n=1 Tax=Erwinia sp. B116 TaxID=1561024 RepID=UPI000C76A694|nr:hypothetical protein [Erwinia sp. B116]PLV53684.1 hypothetical protein NV64_18735 [Erwinia sp. B116]
MKVRYIVAVSAVAIASVMVYRLWDRPVQASTVSCDNVSQGAAVAALEHDLLQQDASKFNKARILIGQITYDSEAISIGLSSVSIPFSLSGRVTREYVAQVSCMDTSQIEYSEK